MTFPLLNRLLLFLLWLAAARPGYGQDSRAVIDSLQRQLAATPADTNRVLLLDELCWQLSSSDLTQATAYGEQGLALAWQLHYRMGRLKCLTDLGNCATHAANVPAGTRYYLQALRLAGQAPARPDIQGYAYNGLANLHILQHEYAEAQQNLEQALVLARQTHSVADRALFGSNLGNVLRLRKQYPQAEYQLQQGLALYDSLGNREGQANSLTNLAQLAFDQHQLGPARRYIQQANTLSRQHGLDYYLGVNLDLLASVEMEAGHLDLAATASQQALRYARQTSNAEIEANCYVTLARISARQKNFQQAYAWQQQYTAAHDSLVNTSKNAEIAALRIRFGTEQKEARIRALTQQQQVQRLRAAQAQSRLWTLRLALAGAVLALAAGGWLYLQLRRNRAELHNKNVALEASTRSKDRLYALIAHDLRGPVIAFAGAAELMSHHLRRGAADQVLRLTAHVRQSAQALHGLLDNLLGWAVAQSGELAYRPTPLAAATLLAECHDLYRPAAEAADVSLHLDAPAALQLCADSNMAHLIVRNLVGNALQVTPPGGQVTLVAAPLPADAAWVRLSVVDTGPGLSDEQISALLAADRQPHAPAAQGHGGAGLGLLVCRAFAERHGGRFGLESTPGVGTTAWVTLPAA
jgi:signal transduction histidine kinase